MGRERRPSPPTRPGSWGGRARIPYTRTPPPRYPRPRTMPRLPLLSFILLAAGVVADPPAVLRVLRALPEGDAGPMATISVSFDRPIAASLEGISADPARILTVTPAVAGKAEWRDPVTL